MRSKKQIFIIAGPNGAGKTTASYTILPQILNVKEFVNADEIAKGLSPFQPEKVQFPAGRIMLERIKELSSLNDSFAFETTLATRSYANSILKWKNKGFNISLVFFWLSSADLAKKRVQHRVKEGGHSIPPETIVRRYRKGINNLFKLYMPIVDNWTLIDNSENIPKFIAQGSATKINVIDLEKWHYIKNQYDE